MTQPTIAGSWPPRRAAPAPPARARRTLPPAGATRRARRATGRSACPPPRPCRPSCRGPPTRPRRRGCRRRSETRGRGRCRTSSIAIRVGGRCAGHDRAGERGAADEGAGLARVHRSGAPSASSGAAPGMAAPADRSPVHRPCRPRRPLRRRAASVAQLPAREIAGVDQRGFGGFAREQRERLGQQAVAGEDGHAFADRRRARSAGRAAACRCPWPAGRRGRASRCGSARPRTRPGARAHVTAGAPAPLGHAPRPPPAPGSAAGACRPRSRCSAWPRTRRRGAPAAPAASGRGPRRRRGGARRATSAARPSTAVVTSCPPASAAEAERGRRLFDARRAR